MTLVGLRRLKRLHFAEDKGITERTLRKWCEQGALPARQIGDRWLVDLDRFVADFDPGVTTVDEFDYDSAAAALYGKVANA